MKLYLFPFLIFLCVGMQANASALPLENFHKLLALLEIKQDNELSKCWSTHELIEEAMNAWQGIDDKKLLTRYVALLGSDQSPSEEFTDCQNALWNYFRDDEIVYPKGYDFYEDTTISHPERLAIRRFLLNDENLRAKLDEIFTKSRATQDENSFLEAGFNPLLHIRKSKIVVARHELLNGFIVKTFLDVYPVNKNHDPDWLWLSRRCQLAKKIGKYLKNKDSTNFSVPRKWLYPIPKLDSNPEIPKRVNSLLIEDDMPLVSSLENKLAWENISYEVLDELATIILHVGGKSYRPDNVWKTRDGTFAFIDTEYPHLVPKLFEIVPYLTEEKGNYWKSMIVGKIFSGAHKQ